MGLFRNKAEPEAAPAADIERGLIARYLARIFARGDLPLRGLYTLLRFLSERRQYMGFTVPPELVEILDQFYSGRFTFADLDRQYRSQRETIIADLRGAAESTPRPEPLATNIELLTRELGLPEAALKIVGLIACYTRYDQVQYLCNTLNEVAAPIGRVVAMLVGEPVRPVEALISPSGELAACGLLQLRESSDQIAGSGGRFAIPWRIDSCLDHHFADFPALRGAFLGAPLEASLNLSDYDHVADDLDLITRLIEGASLENARGVNILLFGPPGTGKTELAKLAAAAAGVTLYAAGEEQVAGREINRAERLSDLAVFQRLLAGSIGTAILFDEFEDVAWQLINRGGSKLYLNRLLELNPVPVIWTSNNIYEIDAAVLRRMSLIVEIKSPPVKQRARILRRLANRYEVELEDHEVHELARRLPATPAVLENALRAAKLSGGGREALERAASGIIRALSGGGGGCAPRHLRVGFRPGAHLRQYGPARPRQARGGGLEPRFLVLPVRTARHRQIGLRPLPRPPARARDHAEARLRSARHVYRPVGEEHRRGLRGRARGASHADLRRGRFVPVRPARRGALLGGEPGERDAHLDGAPPAALLLHHQSDGTVR